MSSKKANLETQTSQTAPETKERKERVVRSKEERIALFESKIVKHKSDIASLESKIDAINNPKRGAKNNAMKAVIEQAKSLGMTPQEIAEKLGFSLTIPTDDAPPDTE